MKTNPATHLHVHHGGSGVCKYCLGTNSIQYRTCGHALPVAEDTHPLPPNSNKTQQVYLLIDIKVPQTGILKALSQGRRHSKIILNFNVSWSGPGILFSVFEVSKDLCLNDSILHFFKQSKIYGKLQKYLQILIY